MKTFDVVVVGAGWSGLACALTCAQSGARVALLDAAPQAGGRARALRLALGDHHYDLDNGQHILIGAYRQTEALMHAVGVNIPKTVLRLPLSLIYPDGFHFVAAHLPAPLHLVAALARAKGLTLADRYALVRLTTLWRSTRWQAPDNAAAPAVLSLATPTLIERLFEPLCLAALNVRLPQASATLFLRVLRDAIGSTRRDSELWVPRVNLSSLLPNATVKTLHSLGAQVALHTLVTLLQASPGATPGWQVRTRDEALQTRAVVLAVPPERALDLLERTHEPALTETLQTLAQIPMAPIATAYLRYAPGTRLPHPVMALREAPHNEHYGQWVFDRGALDQNNDAVLALVISGQGPHLAQPHEAVLRACAQQLTCALGLPQPLAGALIVDKRATVEPTPSLRRPPTALPLPGLYLAADAAHSPYPSTLEGSVRSGLEAARAALNAMGSVAPMGSVIA